MADNAHQLDALLFPGSSGANYATKAGYPIVVVPFGMTMNYAEGAKGSTDKMRPFGVSLVGAHCQDPKLVGIASTPSSRRPTAGWRRPASRSAESERARVAAR